MGLWGNHIGSTGNTLWLNVHLPRQHDSRAEDEYGLDYQQQMFSRRLEVNIPAMTLPQEDHGQTYIALLIAVIEPPRHGRPGFPTLAVIFPDQMTDRPG